MAGAGGAQWPAHQQCVLDLIMWLIVKARVASLTAAGRRSDPILLGPWRVSNWWETFSSVWSCGLRLAAAVGADGGSCTFMCLGLDKTAVWAVSGFWPPFIHSLPMHGSRWPHRRVQPTSPVNVNQSSHCPNGKTTAAAERSRARAWKRQGTAHKRGCRSPAAR